MTAWHRLAIGIEPCMIEHAQSDTECGRTASDGMEIDRTAG
jgi:hypothetical protein